MPKFTERQYDVVRAPKAIHDKLLTRYHEMLPKVFNALKVERHFIKMVAVFRLHGFTSTNSDRLPVFYPRRHSL